jgi:glutaredoxin-related protein
MGIKKFLTESYRSPVLAALLVFILPFVYSIITNTDWTTIFYSIPQGIWVFLIILFLIWITTIAIRRKMSSNSFPMASGNPMFGWNDLGEEAYGGVLWKVRIANPGPYDFDNEKRLPDIEYNPRCPKCKTKLEQNDKFLWYNWNCVYCDFSMKIWDTFSKMRDKVEKVAERKLEVAKELYKSQKL